MSEPLISFLREKNRYSHFSENRAGLQFGENFGEETFSVEFFQMFNVYCPCWVFKHWQNDKVDEGPHYKVAAVGSGQMQIPLDLVPVVVGLLQGQGTCRFIQL